MIARRHPAMSSRYGGKGGDTLTGTAGANALAGYGGIGIDLVSYFDSGPA